MYFGDISINTMSLGGLTVGIGMVIDNSKRSA
jgi:multidrug efflux pump subunit AcrB